MKYLCLSALLNYSQGIHSFAGLCCKTQIMLLECLIGVSRKQITFCSNQHYTFKCTKQKQEEKAYLTCRYSGKNISRVMQRFKLEDILCNPSAEAGPFRIGHLGPHPGGFWISPRRRLHKWPHQHSAEGRDHLPLDLPATLLLMQPRIPSDLIGTRNAQSRSTGRSRESSKVDFLAQVIYLEALEIRVLNQELLKSQGLQLAVILHLPLSWDTTRGRLPRSALKKSSPLWDRPCCPLRAHKRAGK